MDVGSNELAQALCAAMVDGSRYGANVDAQGGYLLFSTSAADATAMRASINSNLRVIDACLNCLKKVI